MRFTQFLFEIKLFRDRLQLSLMADEKLFRTV